MNTPKFKEGDWIKRKKDSRIARVIMLLKTCYSLRLTDGDGWWLDYDYQDNWELTDAPPKNKLEEAAKNYTDSSEWLIGESLEHIEAAFIAGAEWQKEQFEKNRLAACENQTKEEYDRETDFALEIINKEHRQPTFSDAINYGMRLQKESMPLPEDTVLFNKGVAEGKRLAEEELSDLLTIAHLQGADQMKDAVDAKIYGYDDGSYELIASWLDLPKGIYKDGDRVRIIIVKED